MGECGGGRVRVFFLFFVGYLMGLILTFFRVIFVEVEDFFFIVFCVVLINVFRRKGFFVGFV